MCTKGPLIIKLLHHSYYKKKIILEYEGKSETIQSESHIRDVVHNATLRLVKEKKVIKTDVLLTLFVKKKGFRDLMVVDLPGLIPTGNNYEIIRGIFFLFLNQNLFMLLVLWDLNEL